MIRLIESFPERKFVLIGDISNSDVVAGYAEMAEMFPNQIQVTHIRLHLILHTTHLDNEVHRAPKRHSHGAALCSPSGLPTISGDPIVKVPVLQCSRE